MGWTTPPAAAIDQAITANGNDPALHTALTSLAAASQQAVAPFFAEYPELKPLYATYVASTGTVQARNTALLAGFLPALKDKRKQEQALASVTATAGTDPSFATVLLQDATLIHAAATTGDAASADLTKSRRRAWRRPSSSATTRRPYRTRLSMLRPVSTTRRRPPTRCRPVPAAVRSRGCWTGYLDVPQDGFYNIAVTADAGATVTLEIGGVAVPMAAAGATWNNQTAIALTAGAPRDAAGCLIAEVDVSGRMAEPGPRMADHSAALSLLGDADRAAAHDLCPLPESSVARERSVAWCGRDRLARRSRTDVGRHHRQDDLQPRRRRPHAGLDGQHQSGLHADHRQRGRGRNRYRQRRDPHHLLGHHHQGSQRYSDAVSDRRPGVRGRRLAQRTARARQRRCGYSRRARPSADDAARLRTDQAGAVAHRRTATRSARGSVGNARRWQPGAPGAHWLGAGFRRGAGPALLRHDRARRACGDRGRSPACSTPMPSSIRPGSRPRR